jgi:hypothetical protein
MRTDALIARLSADARPVRRLSAPGLRALVWLGAAALVIALVTAIEGLRPDLAERLGDPWFLISRGAAVLTAITAAIATFELSLPDRSPRWLWLSLPSAAVWLSCLGQGCVAAWLARGADALNGPAAGCFTTILATSLPLGALLFAMVRHAGFVRPVATALTGGLALAAAAEAGLTLHHSAEIGLADLLGHLFAVAIVITLATAAARPIFRALGARLPAFR